MPAEKPLPDDVENFGLIETFLWRRDSGFWLRDLHLARLTASAQALGFAFASQNFDAALDGFSADHAFMRVRLELARDGALTLTSAPFTPDDPQKIWRVAIAPDRLDSQAKLLRHKTTRRAFYENALAASGADEVIFLNERDELCEGARTNIFVERDGILLTPPLTSGLLPGVLRADLLASGQAKEIVLNQNDLASSIKIGNSLRGLLTAACAYQTT